MVYSTRRLVACLVLLWAFAGNAFAQNDSQYVIKTRGTGHYLAHVFNNGSYTLQNLSSFTPECLWYSGIEHNITGTTHNYYFYDTVTDQYRFLTAPFQANGSLGLSNSMPETYLLSNTDTIYYFYDWDQEDYPNDDGGGVARGHQYTGINDSTECVTCGHSWGSGQCWGVYWVVYNGGWKTSSSSYYSIDSLPSGQPGGRFHKVTVEDHPKEMQGVSTGSLANLENWTPASTGQKSYSVTASAMTYTYIPAYSTYTFRELVVSGSDSTVNVHSYAFSGMTLLNNVPPASATAQGQTPTSYRWTLSGDGAQFLSFESSGAPVDTITGTGGSASATVYYNTLNNTGTKTATLTLVVTYSDGATQTRTATIALETPCQNPEQAAAPVVKYNDVTVSWYDVADKYKVEYRKKKDVYPWQETDEITGNTVTLTDLAYDTIYQYRVRAYCNGAWETDVPTVYEFETQDAPELLIYGSVYGGGRVANVNGKTEVIVINCDSIGAIFGGNDIAGTVRDSSNITLGVNTGSATTSATIKVGEVYGGGNGYYAYGSNTFHPATTSEYNTVAVNGKVYALNSSNQWTDSVWTNTGTAAVPLPTITKTLITVANDYVKVDTLFGGAKNAFLTANSGKGSAITIDGGTMVAVFGGNNIGGSQGTGSHNIKVDEAAKNSTQNYLTRIHTLYGGGNKVAGSGTDILINGGQIDTLYAGGNSASVAAASVKVDCSLASGSGNTFGHTYSDAIESYSGGVITVKDNYAWNGTGVYNVRTLFGGNNQADMAVVPTITLTSGSAGTVYGGGNAGDMVAEVTTSGIANDFGPLVIDGTTYSIYHSTHVVMDSANMLVDYLYGGCQMSDVYRSTWVEMSDGHVGTVYGGCNISGDVGSRYLFSDAYSYRPRHERYQAVLGATYVKVSGGHVYNDLFAGSNGRYHCNDGRNYVAGVDFDNLDTEGRYIGMTVPSHNETHVYVVGGEVNGSVYAGGNLACVGFINETTPLRFFNPYSSTPVFVGMATVRMTGGHVHGNVFGGGNMASIWGSNSVKVEGGTIDGALYGGNDRIGLVAQITNRVLPSDYGMASDGLTSLSDVRTYISLTGRPEVGTVYGGGNGDYDYSIGDYCNPNDQPVQSNTFVDINIDGFADGATPGGHIGTVYGGGNGVTVTGTTTVFLNVKGENGGDPANYDHVSTIFGGNNKGPLAILPDIYLVKGHVNTVYGGCNAGAMVGGFNVEGYSNVGSRVILRNTYTPVEGGASYPLSGVVTNAVYGGCRMNGVTNNTLVLVEGGTYGDTVNFFGGSDISGTIDGTSHVVVTGGTVGNVYGGGNGGYYYSGNKVYDINDHTKLIDTIASGTITAPDCATSLVEILGGQVGTDASHTSSIFGGGLGAKTSTTGNVTVNIGTDTASATAYTPVIYGDIYGGSALGSVNTNSTNTSTVNFLNGTLVGNVFGGGLGHVDYDTCGRTFGQVVVNIGSDSQAAANCFSNLTAANIYGCNNTNGSPQDNVTVNIYKTGHTASDSATFVNTPPNPLTYAIANVFGGGNRAHYAPQNGITSSEKKTTVKVFNCDNTIGRVFGGGNAAEAHKVETNIYGGRFNQVFGGGNGEVSPADIGDGGATLNVSGGIINQLFGASNERGTINGTLSVNVTNDGNCSYDEDITEFFGGSNLAAMGTTTKPVNLITTIDCGTLPVNISTVYGGSNLADIIGNVTLNIYGGNYDFVYGGSKGQSGPDDDDKADIDGKVTLNLYGGTIGSAFGGSNINGNITDTITVNVLDFGSCGLDLTDLYGASNQTLYEPTIATITSPIVNVMHVAQTEGIRGDVFGGGNLAAVTANPQVNIGYVSSMSGYLPTGFTVPTGGYRAYVAGNVFGGGNEAGVSGNDTVNMNNGTVIEGIYGGCNTSGTVTGHITVNATGGTIGTDANNTANVHGGGYGNGTATSGNVKVTINGATIWGDVYGGSAKGNVNYDDSNTTNVTLASGIIHGNLYGGGLGDNDNAAGVNGKVIVTVNGGTVDTIFGCNNINGAPQSTVQVYINELNADSNPMTINGDVFGGGNLSAFGGTTEVYIQNGNITNKVFGGGNNIVAAGDDPAGVGNANVEMTGGTVLGAIYGGCNTDGDVTGDVSVRLTGGTVGSPEARGKIHGGGYGQNTAVKGDVTITYGDLNATNIVYPMLYGDLYGGSALGTVNDEATDRTTVNIYSGTITGIGDDHEAYGNVFGGGLGNSSNPARVNGEIHVNIGSDNGSETVGKATLSHCNVYGCNNVNGSPQADVYVDLYQTAHTQKDSANYYEIDREYAIYQVFGGGNRAHYAPDNNDQSSGKRTHVTIHRCENTVNYVYGGGNAADALGVVTIVEGGRFNEIYGGGNGRVTAANIGPGGIGLNVVAGNVSFLFRGSNKNGENHGPDYEPPAVSSCLGGLFVDSYFFGTNEAELYYDLNHTITCAEAGDFEYRYVYAGSRWGIVYGDISLTVCGGTIENLFGGCRGYNDYSADVRRFPTYDEITADINAHSEPKDRKYSEELKTYMNYPDGPEPSFVGHGGNINLIVNGGTIGKVFGGCDIKGNVEGQINIIVNDAESSSCPLFVGEVYGASNQWYYQPMEANLNSPKVEIIRIKDAIGGSHIDLPVNNISGSAPTEYEGNVFGGGNFGNVTSNPVVIVGDGPSAKVRIKGNVFGGGNEGNVTGGPNVIIVPKTHTLTITEPSDTDNIVSVTNTVGVAVSSGTSIGEDINLNLLAIPSTNYTFDHWEVTGNGTIINPNAASTIFIMGTEDCTIEAVFNTATTYALNFSPTGGGTMVVKDAQGHTLSSGDNIGQGSVLTLSATPNTTYRFKEWQVNGVAMINPANTTYTMGAGNTTIQAVFEAVDTHTFTLTPPEHGTVVIKDAHGTVVTSPATIGEGSVLTVTAEPAADYALGGWTVTGDGAINNAVAPEISFTMGKVDATLSASFVSTYEFNITDPVNGTVKITDALGYTVTSGASIGVGAVLNLRAKSAAGHTFKEWKVISGDGVIVDPNAPITSFTMGAEDTTIKAIFE